MHLSKWYYFSFIVAAVAISIVSCDNHQEKTLGDPGEIDLSRIDKSTEITTSDILSDLIYVSLESNEECYISNIYQYIISDNNIIILDRDINRVLLFDLNGKFIRQISQQGKGPGEYFNINNISFNNTDGRIGIADVSGKIDFFNTSGEYLSTVVHKTSAHWIESVNEKLVCFFPFPLNKLNNGYQITIIGSSGRILQNHLKKYEGIGQLGYPMSNPYVFSGNDEIIFWEEYSDSVYAINNKLELKVKYRFKYPDQEPAHIKINNIATDPESWKRGMHISKFIDTPGNIFIESVRNGSFNFLVYNKSTKTASRVNMHNKRFGLKETVHGGFTFWPENFNNGMISMVVEAHHFINYITAIADIDKVNNRLIELSDRIDLDANPVIILGILK